MPPKKDGRRRQLRRQGFDTRDAALAERDEARALLTVAGPDKQVRAEIGDLLEALAPTEPLPDRTELTRRIRAGMAVHTETTVGSYLTEWITHRRARLSPNTALSYDGHIRLFLIPHLGDIPLQRLRTIHIQQIFTAIQDRNAEIMAARASTSFEVRNSVRGVRPNGPASQQRILATIRKALNDAIKVHRLIEYNPAINVELESGRAPKARLWTKAAIARWKRTGEKPSPVMVWTPEHFGTFLDHAAVHRPELVDMFELMGTRGLRRGETLGLRDELDVDLDNALLSLEEQLCSVGYKVVRKKLKTSGSVRDVPLADDNVASCRRYLARRARWKLAAGTDWKASICFFVRPDGADWHPERVTQIFDDLVAELVTLGRVPPSRLHDLRHVAATLMLGAGASLKEVQETLGHANYQLTADVYTSVLEELQKTTAAKSIKLVPRSRHKAA